MLFYHYNQNNSFGKMKGEIGQYIIEAPSAVEADAIAKKLIYFDGVRKGIDCDCCGDRWTRANSHGIWATMGYPEPYVVHWYDLASEIHYFDGRVERL